MLILLSLLLLFFQTTDLPPAEMSAVDFSAVKQGHIKDPGCIPLFAREITFRVKNRSDKTIYIHGLKYDERHPFGYLIRLDVAKNQWIAPEGTAPPGPFKDFLARVQEYYESEVYVLPSGKSLKFKESAHESYIGNKVKRVIYISFARDEEPRMVTSEEFILL